MSVLNQGHAESKDFIVSLIKHYFKVKLGLGGLAHNWIVDPFSAIHIGFASFIEKAAILKIKQNCFHNEQKMVSLEN